MPADLADRTAFDNANRGSAGYCPDTASVRWHLTDTGEVYRMELSNGALTDQPDAVFLIVTP
jgi:hypothetical protein